MTLSCSSPPLRVLASVGAGAMLERVQSVQSVIDGGFFLQVVSRCLKQLTGAHHQRPLGVSNALRHSLLVGLKQRGYI